MLIYESLAKAFAAEGVDTQFGLMGDGNMHWMTAMDQLPGMTTVGVRHEHCSVLMAMGYWSATGKPGVCSVTHGPGFTQVMTGLTTAARNNVPLVCFAGETSLGASWALQAMDQAPLARACGAEYIAVHSPARIHDQVREAFYLARTKSMPIVLGVPLDIQKMQAPNLPPYRPSLEFLSPTTALPPDPAAIAMLAEKLAAARHPVLVAGNGAVQADALAVIEALADRTGALLGTSLLAKGAFDHHPFSLGIVGGYVREASRAIARDADLVIAFGAQLSRFTLDGGRMFPDAEIVQVDIAPQALKEGLVVAHTMLRADARLAGEALFGRLEGHQPLTTIRTDDVARRLREGPADSTPYAITDGTLDPRRVFEALETIIPKDYHLVSGSAHQAYWHTAMRGMAPQNYHAVRAFGAIGNAMSFAIGVATARKDGKVVLVEGDGGLLMHIQEMETLQRHGIKLLIVCVDDGAYGAEIHKLRVDGVDDANAIFGRPNFEGVSKAFGADGATVTRIEQLPDLMARYEAGEVAAIWDVHVSDQVMTPPMRDEVAASKSRI
ncbi:thiamine pyrophosphate-binding protein [Arsenicitalea aurantiaca]|uniref:Thiamine pyrophosphate-binding protein n=1 Tax=Arsenicitalea aurantiaca TaxID=1783274 RepID=A0A433XL56_9HYPH|nr:thiamine pyrophosphate-binding protein [Arsenicitalea aurantiaca]RUT34803.1 thiamine pyrophosphate-binding protein [Arsenicitalea aurantiaca]